MKGSEMRPAWAKIWPTGLMPRCHAIVDDGRHVGHVVAPSLTAHPLMPRAAHQLQVRTQLADLETEDPGDE